jgi:hypothetical protein
MHDARFVFGIESRRHPDEPPLVVGNEGRDVTAPALPRDPPAPMPFVALTLSLERGSERVGALLERRQTKLAEGAPVIGLRSADRHRASVSGAAD